MTTSPLRRFLYISGASAFGLALLHACSGPSGDAMTWIGDQMADAGQSMIDGSSGIPGGPGQADDSGMGGMIGTILVDGGKALSEAGQVLADGGVDGAIAQIANTYVKSGSRLEMRLDTYSGPDGSKFTYGYPTIYDKTLNTPCILQTAVDGTTRCMPGLSSGLGVYGYSDSGCTRRLGYGVTPACTPKFMTSLEIATSPSCGAAPSPYQYRAWRVIDTYTGAVYSGTPASCTAFTNTQPGYSFYNIAELTPSEMARMDLDTVTID
jgi:hypothetical protein